ncbi:MAG: hypothetical protein IKX67_08145 [Bacteroidales bacterium]|nr:hypothetical protein [Bacteroidales bacterium]
MKSVRRICAVIAGFVFFFAGLLKLMDPLGASLVVGEYYNFLHLDLLAPTAKIAALTFAFIETIVGAALLTGVQPHLTAIVSGIMLISFTLLTLLLWIKNPAMDCGCFGEAVHLTHFQSFIKNVVLCLLWVVAFIPFKSVWQPRKVKTVSFLIAFLSVIAFGIYSLRGIPAIDFTPFKPGSILMQAQASPSPEDPLLSICDSEGEYCDHILADGDVVLLSAYDPQSLSESDVSALRAFGDSLAATGAAVPVFVGAGEFPGVEKAYTADRRTLMTVNRSNGGATLISNGMVVAKWPLRSLPDASRVSSLASMDGPAAVSQENTPRRLKLQGFLLYLFAVVLLL